MTIGKQIGFSMAGMLAACAVLGATGWYYVTALEDRLDQSIAVTARQIELIGEIKVNVFTFRLQERGMLLFSYIKADAQVAACRDSYDKAIGTSLDKITVIQGLIHSDSGRKLMESATQGIQDYKTQQLEVRKLLAAGQVDEATAMDKKAVVPVGARIVADLDRFSELMHSLNAATNQEATAMKGTAKVVLALGMFVSVFVGLIVAGVMRRATQGLQSTATELERSAQEVGRAATQVSSSSQLLAQGCSEQAASLEETSASSEEVSAMARKNTDHGKMASELVTQSQQESRRTNESLEKTVAAMDDIHTQGGKISKIIKTIDEIAFQTNILALNAAVEAARAGEAGMGFAVVADEVRNLAQRCAQAARETAVLIEESITKSDYGKVKVDEVVEAIRAFTGQTAKLKVLVDEISQGSQEQASGIAQIGKAMVQMEQVTQQTAANAEESAAAAVQLSAQSESLENIVQRLTALAGSGS